MAGELSQIGPGATSGGAGTTVQGAGTPGVPAGGVLTVQFPSSGGIPVVTEALLTYHVTQPTYTDGQTQQGFSMDSRGNATVNPGYVAGALTDISGTITTGGTAQTLAAINASRQFLFIQNLDTTHSLWINFTTTAVQSQPSIQIAPGQAFTMSGSLGFISTELISVIGSTTSQAWAAKQF